MKTLTALLLTLIVSTAISAQITISGSVTSSQGEVLTGVNIYIENSIDGAVSDIDGKFSFTTSETGQQTLIASLIGYETLKSSINCQQSNNLNITLRESENALNAVTIIAGSYEASDKKRTAVLEPLDIYTTAGSTGDVMGAFRTLPGAQPAPEDGRLLVHGGEAYETKTFMDGLLAANPYNSKVPDLPTRGRFSPSLFSGTAFNTGGYSAEYGQALSSVMLLNTTDLEIEESTGFSLMSLGSELNHTWVGKESSTMIGASYFNMAPYESLVENHMDWIKPTESVCTNAMYRHKLKDGIVKAFATGSYSDLKYSMPIESNATTIGNETGNIYTNVTANQCINEKLSYSAGVASSINNNIMNVNEMEIKTFTNNLEGRFKLIADISNRVKLITGVSESFNQYQQDYRQTATSPVWNGNVTNHVMGVFAEPEFRYGTKFAIRPGVRAEYSTLQSQWQVAPRISVAYKTGEYSQVSAAFGQFFQMAENDYLKFNNNLNSEKATHFIGSYQFGDASTRLIRAEAYLKKYQNLVCYDAANMTSAEAYSNSGDGFANGFDIFYRDKKTLKHTDFWISYSYIDTKRKYQNFSTKATPTFVAKHSLNVVSKYFIQSLNSQISGTFTYASPKNYHDPEKSGLMNSQTPYYSDLSVSWSYITHLGNNMTVFYLSVSNMLGRNNIYGYRNTLADGTGSLIPIVPDQKRFVFVGMFINLL